MAKKTPSFTREGTPYELFRIGKNYTEERKQIELILQQIFEAYKKEGVIYTMSKHQNIFMLKVYLQKLVDLGIIKILEDANNNIQYVWNGEEIPDFVELTKRLHSIVIN